MRRILSRPGWRALLLVTSLLASAPASASAHPSSAPTAFRHLAFRSSAPEKDARLTSAPAAITLRFTARPQLGFSSITLMGPSGEIPMGSPAADTGNALVFPIGAPLSSGAYTVRWQTASADGHPIRGEFTFAVALADGEQRADADSGPPAPVVDPHALHTPPPEAHGEHAEYRSVRWAEFVALLSILGVLGFRAFVLPPLASRGVPTDDAADRARRLGQSAAGLYLLTAVVRLYTESVAIHGDEALNPNQLVPMITATTWGLGWILGVAGALLVFAGWKMSKRFEFGIPVAFLGVLGLVLSPAMSGHAASTSPVALSVFLDALHVAAAGLWIGGLLMVLFAGVPAMRRLEEPARDPAVASLVNSFHPLALLCAPIVILTGIGSSWLRLGRVPALWTTEYGFALLWKVALVFVVAGLGAYHSARGRRALGTDEATRRIRLTMVVEVIFAALVIAATTVLVVTPLPVNAGMP